MVAFVMIQLENVTKVLSGRTILQTSASRLKKVRLWSSLADQERARALPRHIVTLMQPDSGRVEVLKSLTETSTDQLAAVRSQVGYLSVMVRSNWLSIAENVHSLETHKLAKSDVDQRVKDALREVNLTNMETNFQEKSREACAKEPDS